LVGTKDDRGWNESHYNGLLHACEEHKCILKVRERVAEDAAHISIAVAELAAEGANVVYLTSAGYGIYAEGVAKNHPRIAFFSVSGSGKEKNQTTYFARLYQMRYLAGVIAGAASKTGVLGYVAAMPNSQINRNINAYAMGMRVANPKAKLLVCFTGSWDDEVADRESVAKLQYAGADVITYQAGKPYAVDEAERRGLFSIGFDNVYEQYSDRFLTATLYDWDVVYEKVLGDYLSGRTHFSSGYWLGMEEDAVKLHTLSPLVPKETAFLTSLAKQHITAQGVFSGVIYDNNGTLHCEEGERIGDGELFTGMDWFVEGVEIYE
jgi:basic membrane protein A